MIFQNDLASDDFEGFRDSGWEENDIKTHYLKKKTTSLFIAKSLSAKSIKKLEEADIEERLNTNDDAFVVCTLSDGEIAEMVLSIDHYEDGDNNDDTIMGTGEKNLYWANGENVRLINCQPWTMCVY